VKLDPNKAYQHPVLRPESTDYPRAEFQVEIDVDRVRNTTALMVEAEFALSDPDLLGLVEDGAAAYVLFVRSHGTHHRSAYTSDQPQISKLFQNGRLSGSTEIYGLLVAMRDLQGFQARGWHKDYENLVFDISAGSVLGVGEPMNYWIDSAEETPISSIFSLGSDENLSDGEWRCDLNEHKVVIAMSDDDRQRFSAARNRVDGTADAAYVMNSLYLPALIWVLNEADYGEEEFSSRRWYRSLEARLMDCGRDELGTKGANRLVDAQRLLEWPFRRLPLMAMEE